MDLRLLRRCWRDLVRMHAALRALSPLRLALSIELPTKLADRSRKPSQSLDLKRGDRVVPNFYGVLMPVHREPAGIPMRP